MQVESIFCSFVEELTPDTQAWAKRAFLTHGLRRAIQPSFGAPAMIPSIRLIFEAVLGTRPKASTKSRKPTARGIAPRVVAHDGDAEPKLEQLSTIRWPAAGEFNFEVMHDEHYQVNLITLAQPFAESDDQKRVTARLVPVDDDPYDKEAVRVDVNGLTVGYLDFDHAPSFRRKLLQKGLNRSATECEGLIVGGILMYDGGRTAYSLMLDIDSAFDFWLHKLDAESNDPEPVSANKIHLHEGSLSEKWGSPKTPRAKITTPS